MTRYKHTQPGYVIVLSLGSMCVSVTLVLGRITTNLSEAVTALSFVVILGMLATLAVLFCVLTVEIRDGALKLSLGPGIFSRRILLNEIESCRTRRLPIWASLGLRITKKSQLWRVSGMRSVELRLRSGARIVIGTDEPRKLEQAIRGAMDAGEPPAGPSSPSPPPSFAPPPTAPPQAG